ncbi:nucleotidyltransferase domain-containing protein [Motiliproteus sp.]|uniref:nucleotidyltransferase domain-containing protein n=1 Tax=Motiliproteus sp. TaxID=1898955 RepID=UPI003BAAE129
MSPHRPIIAQVLIAPDKADQLSLKDWDLVVQQGYSVDLLARLAILLDQNGIKAPERVQAHLDSAKMRANAHAEDVLIEIKAINHALAPANIRPVYLKGAAYIVAEDKASAGRFFSDVDIYIPKQQLDSAEKFLQWQGWKPEELDEYDEHYYREWMHEIPALIHQERGTAIDVHHNLLPLIGRIRLDSRLLQDSLKNDQQTLNPEDRLIHSATHLFCSGEFESAFRDLSDLDLMIREFGQQGEQFWNKLSDRTEQMGLGRLLFYAVRYCQQFFESPVPKSTTAQLQQYSPNRWALSWMDWLFFRVLVPHHSSCQPRFSSTACTLLLIRSHWLRMPIKTLIPHLFRKGVLNPIRNREKNLETVDGA